MRPSSATVSSRIPGTREIPSFSILLVFFETGSLHIDLAILELARRPSWP